MLQGMQLERICSHVVGKKFLRIPCDSDTRMLADIHHSDILVREYISHSFHHRSQACIDTRLDVCNNLAVDRNFFYIAEHRKDLPANLRVEYLF